MPYYPVTKFDKAKVRELLSGIQMGDRTPSQLLWHMKTLAEPSQHDADILRELWQQQLPPDVQRLLVVQPDTIELDKQAEVADKIFECFQRQRLSHISAPGPSTE